MMKLLFVVGAATLMLVSLLPDVASAQRGMRGGGGVGAAAIGGGGRGVAVGGGGFRAANIGGGGRGVAVGGGGFRAANIGGYRGAVGIGRGYGVRTAAIGSGAYGVRGGAWRPGYGVAGGPGWRAAGWHGGRRGWGFPIAAGIVAAGALGYYGYPSYGYGYSSYGGYDDCLAWDGYQWVNTCYQTPALSGGGQYLPNY
jgi:hypothetical protein